MKPGAYCGLATALVCLHFIRDIECLPASVFKTPDKDILKLPHDFPNKSQQNSDEDVRDLENLKPISNSMSVMKSHSSVLTELNGKKEGQFEMKEELNKDGKLLARVNQKVKEEDDGVGPTPKTFVRTEVEIPSSGIHKVIESEPKKQSAIPIGSNILSNENADSNLLHVLTLMRDVFYPRTDSEDNLLNVDPGYKSFSGVQFSPLDMAEYIYWTGDEKRVTLAIEEFLAEGLMSKEEAINYLHEIKANVEYLQRHYRDEQVQEHDNSATEPSMGPLRKNLGFLEKARQAHNEASELMEVRQQMRENINKKSVESYEPDSVQLKQRLLQAGTQGLSDEDYEDLLERLRVADFLYTEYSLEEVIYQLAKVMFSQSLMRGSSEAQEALEKFTRFLETEAETGRISRSLEKKVLDSGRVDNGLKLSNMKNHRFIMSNKNLNLEPSPMKKNTISASAATQDGKSVQKST
ncbi:uncharacterized protein LOC142330329 isoform X2 [Lycorma delicatula]|uniref:uncharacterized protein LOC142330329 isoform X2 n=1 Tax=Lycorma delicatula TaxID=130591 RepID=UPI003F5158C5